MDLYKETSQDVVNSVKSNRKCKDPFDWFARADELHPYWYKYFRSRLDPAFQNHHDVILWVLLSILDFENVVRYHIEWTFLPKINWVSTSVVFGIYWEAVRGLIGLFCIWCFRDFCCLCCRRLGKMVNIRNLDCRSWGRFISKDFRRWSWLMLVLLVYF